MRRIQVITLARLQKHNHRDHRHEAIPNNNNPTDESNVPHAASLGLIRRSWILDQGVCDVRVQESAAADWSVSRPLLCARPVATKVGPQDDWTKRKHVGF